MEKILAGAIMILIGALIWYLKYQTKQQTKREDKILNIVDTSLKDMEETVSRDADNTEEMTKSVGELKNVIGNHLVHNIEKLTTEISKLNEK